MAETHDAVDLPDARDTLVPGTLFAGDYEVVRMVADGGMGSVYEVVQRNTGQARALKVLHRGLADDDRVRQRFIDEARIGSRIESEHVVQVIDAGVLSPSDVPWYVMEFLRGETLDERVQRAGPMGPSEALEVFEQIGHAVGAAHRVGVVHCDLKPENIHLAESRRVDVRRTVKVLDLGIAHVLPALKTSVEIALPAGSPGWLAPEQMHPSGHVTLATDVWALGLLAFYALTGGSYWRWFDQYPAILAEIDGSTLDPASARASALRRPAMPPSGFDDWFARCVDRDPARRFRDATEAVDALRAVLAPVVGRPTTEPPMPPAQADERAARVKMLLLALNEGERRGEVEARIRIGEELLSHGCADRDVPARTAAAYVARAWTREQQHDRAGALDDAMRAVELGPQSPQSHYLLGVLRARSLDFDGALASLDVAATLNPSAAAFVRERGRVAHLLGRYDIALVDRRRVIELDPSRADAWIARALTHAALHDLAAEADLTCAIEREPGSVEALRARAAVRQERGDVGGALADLDEGVSRSPGDGACWFERCRVRRAVGDPVGALEDLRHAAALGHPLAVQELRALGLG